MSCRSTSMFLHYSPRNKFVALVFALLFLASTQAHALSGYATGAGPQPGLYRANLIWLDMTGFNDATARTAAGQNFSLPLPSGNVLSFNIKVSGVATVDDTPAPTWSGASIGNRAYTGIPGRSVLYSNAGFGSFQLVIANIGVKDGAGNARNFTLFATDGESTGICNGCGPGGTNTTESQRYVTTGSNWKLIETIQAVNGNAPGETLSGTGTTTVNVTGSLSNNGAFILSTSFGAGSAGSLTLSSTSGARQGVMFGIMLPTVTLTKALNGSRHAAADQFTLSGAYTAPAAALQSGTTTGSGSTVGNATVSITPVAGNPIALSETMAAGSASPLAGYAGSIACTNAQSGSTTTLPSGSGTSFTVTPLETDRISCTLTNRPRTADLRIQKTNTTAAGPDDQGSDTVASGSTQTYTLTVTNIAGDPVTGAIVRDTPQAGLTCAATNAVTISGPGAPATGSFTVADLTSTGGIVLDTLNAGQITTLTFQCAVN